MAQVTINRAHCIANPGGFKGYGPDCWGLTASDDPAGYDAHAPSNDNGTISPTAALSSFPYAPDAAMAALRHFLSAHGEKVWGRFGFTDAFNETRGLVRRYLSGDRPGPDHGDDRELPQRACCGSCSWRCPKCNGDLRRLGFTESRCYERSGSTGSRGNGIMPRR